MRIEAFSIDRLISLHDQGFWQNSRNDLRSTFDMKGCGLSKAPTMLSFRGVTPPPSAFGAL